MLCVLCIAQPFRTRPYIVMPMALLILGFDCLFLPIARSVHAMNIVTTLCGAAVCTKALKPVVTLQDVSCPAASFHESHNEAKHCIKPVTWLHKRWSTVKISLKWSNNEVRLSISSFGVIKIPCGSSLVKVQRCSGVISKGGASSRHAGGGAAPLVQDCHAGGGLSCLGSCCYPGHATGRSFFV
jgi:hypothetical protein